MFENFRFPHSAEVKMWLDCGIHGLVELSRVTPNLVVARVACDVPPCDADLVVVVDGEEMRKRVSVANGLSKESRKALVLPIDQVAPF